MDSGLSDIALVKNVRIGNTEAFTLLVQRYQEVAYAAAYALVQNFHDAQDIAQEAWIKAYQKLATYDPTRHFGAWLYGISRHCAINWLSNQHRMPTTPLDLALKDPSPQPDEVQEKRELHQMVQRALASLSEVHRETTVLYYINGYSQEEICQILDVPLGTVKRRLHDARRRLRQEVMVMIKGTFEANKLPCQFTQDVVNCVSQLKMTLINDLSAEFQQLAQMSEEEFRERQNQLLRSLLEILSVSGEEVEMGKALTFEATELAADQQTCLWQTLHELELMDIVSAIRNRSIFHPLIQGFDEVKVEVGRYDWPKNETVHHKLYIRFWRPNPDGSHRSIQLGPIND